MTRVGFQVYLKSCEAINLGGKEMKECAICGKTNQTGKAVVRKGLAKKKGGTGSKITRSTKRKFLPNLQKVRILLEGKARRVYICAKCIKKGNFRKV